SRSLRSSLVPHSHSSSVLTGVSVPHLAGAGRTDLPRSVLAHERHVHPALGVRGIPEVVGDGAGGTVTVDSHVGDSVDVTGSLLGNRVALVGKNIRLDTLLRAAGVGAEVGVARPLQRIVLADRRPGHLLLVGEL